MYIRKQQLMIRADIHTAVRTINVPCENDRDKAVTALQDAVGRLTVEDGRCRFTVTQDGSEVYSWSYQPTIREEKKKTVKKESKYVVGSVVYVLLNGEELNYDNLYADGAFFDTVAKAREFMKERGWAKTQPLESTFNP